MSVNASVLEGLRKSCKQNVSGGWVQKSYELAGLPPTMRKTLQILGFRVGMLQNGGFGAIPWGEVANREPGSYIYIY